ncbi:class I SAM-dependent methyltransferase [Actinocorallia longicatena]|uniref:Class I SAM-dependent methyltransferase n=1 Tax=Actinocorallia longicatena TaxID=111803 RepID=A0ABP6QFB0_9ACTN
MHVDRTGKVSLDHIYDRPDPRAYFNTLRAFDYRVPQYAKPHFAALIAEYASATGRLLPRVLDLGCSYGINAALLNHDATMDDLYDRYDGAPTTRGDLIDRDRRLSEKATPVARFIGLDTSEPALTYAVQAKLLSNAIHADLESAEPTESQAALLFRTDLVISTGCLGYIGEKSISRLLTAFGGRRPWMAHFVLRMFPFTPIAELLTDAGYRTVRAASTFRQRRFATPEEQREVLERLAPLGPDPHEADGWLHAELFISIPDHHPRTRIEAL